MLKLSNVTEPPDLLDAAKRHIDQALSHFNDNLIAYSALMNLRDKIRVYVAPLGRCAGKAYLNEQIIVLDNFILENSRADTVNDTLPHEIAHLVADIIYGRNIAPHGVEWRNCCEFIGHPHGRRANAFHAEVHKPLRNTRKFNYICGTCEKSLKVGLNIHRKIFAKQIRICPACRAVISAVNFVSEV